jgi:hypothetical protein
MLDGQAELARGFDSIEDLLDVSYNFYKNSPIACE